MGRFRKVGNFMDPWSPFGDMYYGSRVLWYIWSYAQFSVHFFHVFDLQWKRHALDIHVHKTPIFMMHWGVGNPYRKYG